MLIAGMQFLGIFKPSLRIMPSHSTSIPTIPIINLLIIWSNKNWFYSSSSSYPRNFLLVHCKGTKFSIFHCTVKGSDFEQIFGRTYISKLSGPLESMCLCICHFLIFGVFLYHTSFPVNNWVLNTSLRRLLYVRLPDGNILTGYTNTKFAASLSKSSKI